MAPELVQNLISAIILALVGVAVYALKSGINVAEKYFDAKIGVENMNELKGYAKTSVRQLEQSPAYQSLETGQKKQLAVSWVSQYAQSRGLPVAEGFVDGIIEEAVHVMKTEAPELYEIAEPILNDIVGSASTLPTAGNG